MSFLDDVRRKCIAIDDSLHWMREGCFQNWCEHTVFPQAVCRAIEACRPVFPIVAIRQPTVPQQNSSKCDVSLNSRGLMGRLLGWIR